MIDVVKGIEPEVGYGAIMQLSEAEAQMREARIKQNEDSVHLLRCRLQLRHLDQGPPHPQGRAGDGPANGISTCIKGKFGWDYVNSPDRLTKPLIREGRQVSRGDLG